MVIFQDADVVVGERQVVPGLGEEGVAFSRVLEVVYHSAKKKSDHFDVPQVLPEVTNLSEPLFLLSPLSLSMFSWSTQLLGAETFQRDNSSREYRQFGN